MDLVDAVDRRIAIAAARAGKIAQAVLAKAFSGELVSTEAELARAEGRDYETAAQLLERITASGVGASNGGRTRKRSDAPQPRRSSRNARRAVQLVAEEP